MASSGIMGEPQKQTPGVQAGGSQEDIGIQKYQSFTAAEMQTQDSPPHSLRQPVQCVAEVLIACPHVLPAVNSLAALVLHALRAVAIQDAGGYDLHVVGDYQAGYDVVFAEPVDLDCDGMIWLR